MLFPAVPDCAAAVTQGHVRGPRRDQESGDGGGCGTGAVQADGKTWTARMDTPDGKAPKGSVVKALRIEGVRLIVTAK